MSLYIRDHHVAVLASRLQTITGARTKTDTVRTALEHELERHAAMQTFDTRNLEVLQMADALGAANPGFDLKAFTDEMWGG